MKLTSNSDSINNEQMNDVYFLSMEHKSEMTFFCDFFKCQLVVSPNKHFLNVAVQVESVMYFIVKYIELPRFLRQSEPASQNPSSEQISMQTFEKLRERSLSATKSSRRNIINSAMYDSLIEPIDVMVPIGDENKEVLINPDCFLGSIIDYICEVAVIPKTKPFEICTVDGEITEFSHVLSTSGLEYFEPKQTYLILLQEFDEIEGVEKKTPLLSKTSELYSSILSKFRRFSSLIELEPKKTNSKPVSKSKERLKSRRASRKDMKIGTLPPIKQNN